MGYQKDLYTEQMLGYNTWRTVATCKHCKKDYIQVQTDQEPGFRMPDDDICPYCKQSNGSSMAVEYENYPMEDTK